MGRSLIEPDYIEAMRDLMVEAGIVGCRMLLPLDVMVVHMTDPSAPARAVDVEAIGPEDMILDVGPRTIATWSRVIQNAGTVVWNGPLGAYEMSPYEEGTYNLANALVHSSASTLVAGGDTLKALQLCELRHHFPSLSTAGAAFIDRLAGRDLPALRALRQTHVAVDRRRSA